MLLWVLSVCALDGGRKPNAGWPGEVNGANSDSDHHVFLPPALPFAAHHQGLVGFEVLARCRNMTDYPRRLGSRVQVPPSFVWGFEGIAILSGSGGDLLKSVLHVLILSQLQSP